MFLSLCPTRPTHMPLTNYPEGRVSFLFIGHVRMPINPWSDTRASPSNEKLSPLDERAHPVRLHLRQSGAIRGSSRNSDGPFSRMKEKEKVASIPIHTLGSHRFIAYIKTSREGPSRVPPSFVPLKRPAGLCTEPVSKFSEGGCRSCDIDQRNQLDLSDFISLPRSLVMTTSNIEHGRIHSPIVLPSVAVGQITNLETRSWNISGGTRV